MSASVGAERRAAGLLYVITAPSGTGKSTLARGVVAALDGLEFSVSYTTRPPRPGEREGREYHFIDRARFESMIAGRDFLEWADVYGQFYGTSLERTRGVLEQGRDLLLDIDVQGARQVRRGSIESVSVMVLPPDFPTLEARLRGRGSEDEAARRRRLAASREEAAEYPQFDYLIVNEDLERSVAAIRSIIVAERLRTARAAPAALRILSTFPSEP